MACPSVLAVRRLILAISVLALVLSACSSAGSETTTSVADDRVTTSSATNPATTPSTQPGDTTTSEPGATDTTSDRPLAPAFTLQLGDGGTYTLSEAAKPVYLVFWAEW